MDQPRLRVFIDESGDCGLTGNRTDHFVLTAAAFWETQLPAADSLLEEIRIATNRNVGHHLHFNKFSPKHKLAAVSLMAGGSSPVGLMAVVTCKSHLARDLTFTHDHAYMLSLRYLLERLSWAARDRDGVVDYTLAHKRHFKVAKLREYEEKIKCLPTQISWANINPSGGSFDQPQTLSYLQLADFGASAIGLAFNGNGNGITDQLYLQTLVPRLYRRNGNLTSYGLKMHPWRESTKAAYPWIAAL